MSFDKWARLNYATTHPDFIVATSFINIILLSCSFTKCISKQTIKKTIQILKEISTFRLFLTFSFQLLSLPKFEDW